MEPSDRVEEGIRRAGGDAEVDRQALLAFFVLAYALCWIPISLMIRYERGLTNSAPPYALYYLADFSPSVAGVLVLAVIAGPTAAIRLLRRSLDWSANGIWYFGVLLGPLALHFIHAFLLTLLTRGTVVPSQSVAWRDYPMLVFSALFLGAGLGEELGWRGFALPRLEARYGVIKATMILGLLWGAWHFPNNWWPGEEPWYVVYAHGRKLLATVALAIIVTWIYKKTRGNLPAVMLLHASWNATSHAFGVEFANRSSISDAGYLLISVSDLVLLWLVAGAVLVGSDLQEPSHSLS